MTPFVTLARPTVFISASRDMHLEASIAVEVIQEIRRNHPTHRHLDYYLWTKSDQVWRADATWQELIPSPADPMILAVITLFGERLDEPLPANFPLPPDCPLPPEVQFPWEGDEGRIPLTGTLFEYLYARTLIERRTLAERPAPLLVYSRADGQKATQDLPAEERDWGFGRHYESVSRSRRRRDVDDYFRQVGFLTTFFDRIHKLSERPCTFLDARPETFRTVLREELARVLGLRDSRYRVEALKGLESYQVTDRPIFAGRSRTIDKIFDEMGRKERTPDGQLGAIILGASGAGKSSVLKAGVIAEILEGARNSLDCSYRVLLTTPRALGVGTACHELVVDLGRQLFRLSRGRRALDL